MLKKIIFLIFITLHVVAQSADDLKEHPLMNKANRELLYNLVQCLSNNIDAQFPGKQQIICGLGQSPAYAIKMLARCDKLKRRTDRQYKYIAFSGGHYKAKEKCPEGSIVRTHLSEDTTNSFMHFCAATDDKIVKDETAIPDRAQRVALLSHLQSIGLADRDLNNKAFIILDRGRFGCGMRSFNDVMEMARYINKPTFFFFYNCAQFGSTFPGNQGIPMDQATYKLMFNLSYDTTSARFHDRLLPEFPYAAWCTNDPKAFRHHPNAKKILAALRHFVNTKLKQPAQLRPVKRIVDAAADSAPSQKKALSDLSSDLKPYN